MIASDPRESRSLLYDRCFYNKLKLYPNKCEPTRITQTKYAFYSCNCHTSALKYENYWEGKRRTHSGRIRM